MATARVRLEDLQKGRLPAICVVSGHPTTDYYRLALVVTNSHRPRQAVMGSLPLTRAVARRLEQLRRVGLVLLVTSLVLATLAFARSAGIARPETSAGIERPGTSSVLLIAIGLACGIGGIAACLSASRRRPKVLVEGDTATLMQVDDNFAAFAALVQCDLGTTHNCDPCHC